METQDILRNRSQGHGKKIISGNDMQDSHVTTMKKIESYCFSEGVGGRRKTSWEQASKKFWVKKKPPPYPKVRRGDTCQPRLALG
jgi:hypothetical protein